MKVVLISCVKTKLSGKHLAKDLYISPLFRKAWAKAQTMNPDKVYILSAKYGLLDPETEIESYDETLVNASASRCRSWSEQVLKQLEEAGCNLSEEEFIFFAGQKYYKYLLPHLCHYQLPYQGLRGFGDILRFLGK